MIELLQINCPIHQQYTGYYINKAIELTISHIKWESRMKME